MTARKETASHATGADRFVAISTADLMCVPLSPQPNTPDDLRTSHGQRRRGVGKTFAGRANQPSNERDGNGGFDGGRFR